jgi:hypothetical protein
MILDSALASGEWRYTQGGAQRGVEPARNVSAKYGDCTDYTLSAAIRALGSSFAGGWNKKLNTVLFREWVADSVFAELEGAARASALAKRSRVISGGYRGVPADSARAGDVVVQGKHAGIYLGAGSPVGTPGSHWGVANNGLPATESRANRDSPTGPFNFSKLLDQPTYFVRPLVRCTA